MTCNIPMKRIIIHDILWVVKHTVVIFNKGMQSLNIMCLMPSNVKYISVLCVLDSSWKKRFKFYKEVEHFLHTIDRYLFEKIDQYVLNFSVADIITLGLCVWSKRFRICVNIIWNDPYAENHICIYYWFILLVGNCPPVPFIAKADANSSSTAEGSTVTVTCHVGHRFPNGHRDQQITCSGSEWIQTYHVCLSEWLNDIAPYTGLPGSFFVL